MKARAMIFLRALGGLILLALVAALVFPAALQYLTPAGTSDGARNLPGRQVTMEDAVSKGSDVFVGSVTDAGWEVLVPPQMSRRGHLYRGIKVTILQVYSGHQLHTLPIQQLDHRAGPIGDQTSVAVWVQDNMGEIRPQAGKAYFFMAPRKSPGMEPPYHDPEKDDDNYVASKLVSVTDNNIVIVNKLIESPRGFFSF